MSLEPKTYSLCEAVADIALTVQWAIDQSKWTEPPDSREKVRLIIEWAEEFERLHADSEYLEEIERFTLNKLSQST